MQKSGKSLCTLYPMEGYFIALVVVGAKQEAAVEMELSAFTPYLQRLYTQTPFSLGGHWLMIDIRDSAVLRDVMELIALRVKPKASVVA